MKQKYAIIAVIVAVIVAVGAAALIGSSKKQTSMRSMDMSANAMPVKTDKVMIEEGHQYSPSTISVKKGTTVTWTNMDADEEHSVTVDSGDGPMSSLLSKGQTYTYTFTKTSTISYHCEVHPDMHGKVIVTD